MKSKKIFFPFFIFLFIFLSFLAVQSTQGETIEVEKGTFTAPHNQDQLKHLFDDNYKTFWESKKNAPYLEISSPKPLGGLYLCFAHPPAPWEAQKLVNDEWLPFYQGGKEGFLHEYFPIDGEENIRIEIKEKAEKLQLAEVFLLDQGEVPTFVQRWAPPVEKADILLITAHPDDEVLWFGGLLPYYGGELNKKVQTALMTPGSRTRYHEYLNSLWTCGIKNYPVVGKFSDSYFKNLEEAYNRWGKNKSRNFIVSLFRQFQPEVVITHDVKGEYGHGAHRLCAAGVNYAIEAAADTGKHEASALLYGPWRVNKVYFHLGDTMPIMLNWDIPLDHFNGKTGYEVAQEAYQMHITQHKTKFFVHGPHDKYSSYHFSLIYTNVGPDRLKNDFLENIP